MRRFVFYLFFVLLAFASACGMFILKFHVVEKEEKLSQMHKQISNNNRSIHVLKAEWENLNDHKRLVVLAKENTKLSPQKQTQLTDWDDFLSMGTKRKNCPPAGTDSV